MNRETRKANLKKLQLPGTTRQTRSNKATSNTVSKYFQTPAADDIVQQQPIDVETHVDEAAVTISNHLSTTTAITPTKEVADEPKTRLGKRTKLNTFLFKGKDELLAATTTAAKCDDFEVPAKKPKRAPRATGAAPKAPKAPKVTKTRSKKQPDIKSAFLRNEQLFADITAQHCMADNFSPDDLQLALAISKSEAESKGIVSIANDDAKDVAAEPQSIREQLKRYGFRTAPKEDYNNIAALFQTTSSKRDKKSKWAKKFTALTLRDAALQLQKVDACIKKFLRIQCTTKQLTAIESTLKPYRLTSNMLQRIVVTAEQRLLATDVETAELANFYVELFEVSHVPAGHLLKDWGRLQGRDDLSPKSSKSANSELREAKLLHVYNELEEFFCKPASRKLSLTPNEQEIDFENGKSVFSSANRSEENELDEMLELIGNLTPPIVEENVKNNQSNDASIVLNDEPNNDNTSHPTNDTMSQIPSEDIAEHKTDATINISTDEKLPLYKAESAIKQRLKTAHESVVDINYMQNDSNCIKTHVVETHSAAADKHDATELSAKEPFKEVVLNRQKCNESQSAATNKTDSFLTTTQNTRPTSPDLFADSDEDMDVVQPEKVLTENDDDEMQLQSITTYEIYSSDEASTPLLKSAIVDLTQEEEFDCSPTADSLNQANFIDEDDDIFACTPPDKVSPTDYNSNSQVSKYVELKEDAHEDIPLIIDEKQNEICANSVYEKVSVLESEALASVHQGVKRNSVSSAEYNVVLKSQAHKKIFKTNHNETTGDVVLLASSEEISQNIEASDDNDIILANETNVVSNRFLEFEDDESNNSGETSPHDVVAMNNIDVYPNFACSAVETVPLNMDDMDSEDDVLFLATETHVVSKRFLDFEDEDESTLVAGDDNKDNADNIELLSSNAHKSDLTAVGTTHSEDNYAVSACAANNNIDDMDSEDDALLLATETHIVSNSILNIDEDKSANVGTMIPHAVVATNSQDDDANFASSVDKKLSLNMDDMDSEDDALFLATETHVVSKRFLDFEEDESFTVADDDKDADNTERTSKMHRKASSTVEATHTEVVDPLLTDENVPITIDIMDSDDEDALLLVKEKHSFSQLKGNEKSMNIANDRLASTANAVTVEAAINDDDDDLLAAIAADGVSNSFLDFEGDRQKSTSFHLQTATETSFQTSNDTIFRALESKYLGVCSKRKSISMTQLNVPTRSTSNVGRKSLKIKNLSYTQVEQQIRDALDTDMAADGVTNSFLDFEGVRQKSTSFHLQTPTDNSFQTSNDTIFRALESKYLGVCSKRKSISMTQLNVPTTRATNDGRKSLKIKNLSYTQVEQQIRDALDTDMVEEQFKTPTKAPRRSLQRRSKSTSFTQYMQQALSKKRSIDLTQGDEDNFEVASEDDDECIVLSDDEINYSIWQADKSAHIDADEDLTTGSTEEATEDGVQREKPNTSKHVQNNAHDFSYCDMLDIDKSFNKLSDVDRLTNTQGDLNMTADQEPIATQFLLTQSRDQLKEFGIMHSFSQSLSPTPNYKTPTKQVSETSVTALNDASFLSSPSETSAPMKRYSSSTQKFNALLQRAQEEAERDVEPFDDFDEFDRLVYGSASKLKTKQQQLPTGFEQLLTAEISFNAEEHGRPSSTTPQKPNVTPPRKQSATKLTSALSVNAAPEEFKINGLTYVVRVTTTPKPNFAQLSDADVLQKLYKFGIKPLKRHQALKILEYIYDETHPILEEANDDQAVEIVAVEDEEIIEVLPTTSKAAKSKTKTKSNNVVTSTAASTSAEPLVAAGSSKDQQLNLRDCFGDLLLRYEHQLYAELKHEIYIFQTNVSKKLSQALLPLHVAWFNLVSAHSTLHEALLMYEPIDLQEIYLFFKSIGYRYDPKDLKSFFDRRCIIFRYDLSAPASKQATGAVPKKRQVVRKGKKQTSNTELTKNTATTTTKKLQF